MSTLEFIGTLCVVALVTVWFVISYGEWEHSDPAQDPYINYGAHSSAGVLLSWGFVIPLLLSIILILVLFMWMGWYALYVVSPVLGTLFWLGHKIVRHNVHIPEQIAAAIVYLHAYEKKRKPLEIGETRVIDSRLGKEHWSKTPIAVQNEYIYLNMDNRHYELPWRAIESLERAEIKPPNCDSYIPGLRIRLPTEIESTIVLAMTVEEIDYVMVKLNPALFGDSD